jgi:hypothetical protein
MGNDDITRYCNHRSDGKNKKIPVFENVFWYQKFNHEVNSCHISRDIEQVNEGIYFETKGCYSWRCIKRKDKYPEKDVV